MSWLDLRIGPPEGDQHCYSCRKLIPEKEIHWYDQKTGEPAKHKAAKPFHGICKPEKIPDLVMVCISTLSSDSGTVVDVSGDRAEYDIDSYGSYDLDFMADAPVRPDNSGGLWVWEGRVDIRGNEDGYDSSYHDGRWRRPSFKELLSFLKGESSWPKIKDNPEYCDEKLNHVEGKECKTCPFGFVETPEKEK